MNVTEEMIEAACAAHWPGSWPGDRSKDILMSRRADMRAALEAALSHAPSGAGEAVDGAPERLWLSAANSDQERQVWFDPDEGGTPYIRADLALPATEEKAADVKVKPLEWQEPGHGSNWCWTAKSPFGVYSVVNEDGWFATLDPDAKGFTWDGDRITGTRHQGFAAAQADYEARILSALASPIPAPPSELEARCEALEKALELARPTLATREIIDESAFGKGRSPATRILKVIDAALANGGRAE